MTSYAQYYSGRGGGRSSAPQYHTSEPQQWAQSMLQQPPQDTDDYRLQVGLAKRLMKPRYTWGAQPMPAQSTQQPATQYLPYQDERRVPGDLSTSNRFMQDIVPNYGALRLRKQRRAKKQGAVSMQSLPAYPMPISSLMPTLQYTPQLEAYRSLREQQLAEENRRLEPF